MNEGKPVKKPIHRAKIQALFAATALALAACGGSDDDAPAPAPAPTPAPAPAAPTLDKVKALFAKEAGLWASSVPSGEQAFSIVDSCYLTNGANKAMRIAALDPAANGYRVGVKFENIEILAERDVTNADGSLRHEVDVRYDEAYTDGTRDTALRAWLISGSSAGTAECTQPTTSDELRHLGNRRLVGFNMNPRNVFVRNHKLDGTGPSTPEETLRREVRVNISDPGGRATYAIVSGPGFPSGKWKMLSPRTIREAPEMQGKTGNQNLGDNDNFRICNAPADARYTSENADCVGRGVGGDSAAYSVNSPLDAKKIEDADNSFNAWGFSATATYTVAVYADDGWKTPNGQAGKTPIATYTTTVGALPYTFAQMVAHPDMAPSVDTSSMDLSQMAAAARASGGTVDLTLKQPKAMAGEAPMTTSFAYFYEHGPKTGATGAWPRVRALNTAYPAAGKVSVRIPGKPEAASEVTYGELWLNGTDRNGRVVARSTTFN